MLVSPLHIYSVEGWWSLCEVGAWMLAVATAVCREYTLTRSWCRWKLAFLPSNNSKNGKGHAGYNVGRSPSSTIKPVFMWGRMRTAAEGRWWAKTWRLWKRLAVARDGGLVCWVIWVTASELPENSFWLRLDRTLNRKLLCFCWRCC